MSPIQVSGPLRAFRPPTAFAITKTTALDGSGCAPAVVCVSGWGGGLVACPGMGLAVQRDQAAKQGLGSRSGLSQG